MSPNSSNSLSLDDSNTSMEVGHVTRPWRTHWM
jgi:hypothetical protein